MYCKKCGYELNDETNYCARCGEYVNEVEILEVDESKSKTKKIPSVVKIFIMALLLFLVLAIIWYTQNIERNYKIEVQINKEEKIKLPSTPQKALSSYNKIFAYFDYDNWENINGPIAYLMDGNFDDWDMVTVQCEDFLWYADEPNSEGITEEICRFYNDGEKLVGIHYLPVIGVSYDICINGFSLASVSINDLINELGEEYYKIEENLGYGYTYFVWLDSKWGRVWALTYEDQSVGEISINETNPIINSPLNFAERIDISAKYGSWEKVPISIRETYIDNSGLEYEKEQVDRYIVETWEAECADIVPSKTESDEGNFISYVLEPKCTLETGLRLYWIVEYEGRIMTNFDVLYVDEM